MYPKHLISSHIINILSKPTTGPQLVSELKKEKFTEQAVYASLRGLIKDEVVQKVDGAYTITRSYARSMTNFFNKTLHNYDEQVFLKLGNKESVSYIMNSPNALGIIWNDYYNSLCQVVESKTPFIAYHPYLWLIFSRTDSELNFFRSFTKEKKVCLYTIATSDEFSKETKKNFESEYLKINTGIYYKRFGNKFVNVLDDYIFYVTFPTAFEKKVAKVFEQAETMSGARVELSKLIHEKMTCKMIIRKDKTLADNIRKMVYQDFVL